ncbi:hypothetical protein Ahy_B05g079419 isoform B [Arachis hypogaea]|uniref:Protein FAR1-RELATED SEQUENCE n=1 Tax=Arachis hypogaea TaxID=3818 RepID=A0A444Z9U0_ARAHY|nr:hypothetical protein Ahy_B05g079419 isoform B [Arachis hypogaea]
MNLIECINSVHKGMHNLPVMAIIRSTFYWLNELFIQKSVEAHEHVRNRFTYLEFATKRVEESFRSAGNIVVNWFDRCNEMFEIRKIQRLDWQVYVYDVYKISKFYKVYRGVFVPMGDPSTWSRYDGANVITNWTLRHTAKGRPKSTCYLNEMDSRDTRAPR